MIISASNKLFDIVENQEGDSGADVDHVDGVAWFDAD